jgi:hypothetical protein
MPLPDGRYEPSKEETHFGHSGDRDYARFAQDNLTGACGDGLYSFYLGYYLHIVADAAWVKGIYRAERRTFRDAFDTDAAFNAAVKMEWDVLDFRFLRESGAPRLLTALMSANGMPAIDCPFIRRDALEAQFIRTIDKYRAPGPADAPTRYLSKDALDGFIRDFTKCLSVDMVPARDKVWLNWHKHAT